MTAWALGGFESPAGTRRRRAIRSERSQKIKYSPSKICSVVFWSEHPPVCAWSAPPTLQVRANQSDPPSPQRSTSSLSRWSRISSAISLTPSADQKGVTFIDEVQWLVSIRVQNLNCLVVVVDEWREEPWGLLQSLLGSQIRCLDVVKWLVRKCERDNDRLCVTPHASPASHSPHSSSSPAHSGRFSELLHAPWCHWKPLHFTS